MKSKNCSDSAFEYMTSDSNYWAGYLLADGNLSNATISISSIDLEVIEKYVEFVGGLAEVISKKDAGSKSIKGKDCYCSDLYSYAFSNQLVISKLTSNYGMVENKTHIALVPEVLKMDRDLWRGYCEGNASYGIDTQGRGVLELSSGSEQLCQQFLDYCKSLIPISKVNVTKESGKNGWRVRFCGKYGAYILRHLYQDTQPIMTRKYNKAAEIIKLYAEELAVLDSIPTCKQCNGKRTVKDGKGSTGAQRYQCRDCKIKFIPIELQTKTGRKSLRLNVGFRELVFA